MKTYSDKNNNNLEESSYEKKTILVIGGAGARIAAYAGAVEALHTFKMLEDFKLIVGTSAGGLISLMLAIGMHPNDISRYILSLDFKDFLDSDTNYKSEFTGSNLDVVKLIAKAFSSKKSVPGVYKGNAFIQCAQELCGKYLGKPNATFRDLYLKTLENPKKYKNLILVGFVVDGLLHKSGNTQYFGYSEIVNKNATDKLPVFDDMPLCVAAAATSSIPVLFEPKEYNGIGYSDGGLGDNFPMEFCNAVQFWENKKIDDNSPKSNPSVLGIKVFSESELFKSAYKKLYHPSLFSYFVNFLLNSISQTSIINKHRDNIIPITDMELGFADFSISEDDKKKLLTHGFNETYKFLQKSLVNRYDDEVKIADENFITTKLKRSSEESLENYIYKARKQRYYVNSGIKPIRKSLTKLANFLDSSKAFSKHLYDVVKKIIQNKQEKFPLHLAVGLEESLLVDDIKISDINAVINALEFLKCNNQLYKNLVTKGKIPIDELFERDSSFAINCIFKSIKKQLKQQSYELNQDVNNILKNVEADVNFADMVQKLNDLSKDLTKKIHDYRPNIIDKTLKFANSWSYGFLNFGMVHKSTEKVEIYEKLQLLKSNLDEILGYINDFNITEIEQQKALKDFLSKKDHKQLLKFSVEPITYYYAKNNDKNIFENYVKKDETNILAKTIQAIDKWSKA